MLLIEDILVSEELFTERFLCHLKKCKGACCWEGDYGAPMEDEEIKLLQEIREKIRPYLTAEGNQILDNQGVFTQYQEVGIKGTPLIEGRACAYLSLDEQGIGQCGIEKAFQAGEITFRKPISCHLYPVRYTKLENTDFQALNYERWSICKAACTFGAKQKMPLFRFVKDALVRKFGATFYTQMEEIYEDALSG